MRHGTEKAKRPGGNRGVSETTSSEEIMGKATLIPNSVNFPKYHQVCDCCGEPASFQAMQATRGTRETCLGGFNYQICLACISEIDAMSEEEKEVAIDKAIVRHALYYSAQYGEFVANWLGVEGPHDLEAAA